MTDTYTEVRKEGYLSRIWNALSWVVVWILLFIFSFFVLYWNEWKVNLAIVAKTATDVTSETQNLDELQGKLVSTFGTLKAKDWLSDAYLKAWNYISIRRNVEVYAWVETTKEEREKHLWGSETTTTNYHYNKKWVSSAPDSSNFKYPEWHKNIKKSIEDKTLVAENLQIENFNLDEKISLPWLSKLNLTDENVILSSWLVRQGNYLFKPYNVYKKDSLKTQEEYMDDYIYGVKEEKKQEKVAYDLNNPKIWDIRISYEVLENPVKNTTVFWKLENKNTINTFVWPKGSELYRAFVGNKEEAIKTLQTEHKILTWWLRILWFLMMWIGLVSILNPLTVVLDVIPFLGNLWSWAIKTLSFVVALVLSLVTIIISMIIHNIWALIIVIILFLAFIVYLWKKKKKLKTEKVEEKTEEKKETQEEK